jgi:hypothetical protein
MTFFVLPVSETNEKLHQLDEDGGTAYIDKRLTVIIPHEVDDESCQRQYQEEYVQYVSYFIGVHEIN